LKRNLKSLRDARHLDKYIYTLSHELFYEPFETHYNPSEEYTILVKDILKEVGKDWLTSHDGFWCHVHPRQFTWPVQGWKVHVSTTLSNSSSILKKAARIALMNDIAFKFAIDKNVLGMMGLKRWRRGSSGKFITMYPPDLPAFTNLLEQLYQELRFEEGPYILSDKRYKDCRVLYYRYGGMSRTTRMDITGGKILCLISPDGAAIPDIRTPYFAPPAWAEDPFPTPKVERRETALNKGRYLVKKALAFSNSGGVYLAEDRQTSKEIILKEARAHTVQDGRGNDAITRLKKEYALLELFGDTGITPKPIDFFQEWENSFLAEEYIDGVDLRVFILTQTPLLRINPSLDESREYYEIFRKILRSFAQAVSTLHERGVVFGDLSPNNIKIDPETYTVRLIDFESAMRIGVDEPTFLYTPGFKSKASIRENGQSFADDCYALAAIMSYMLFPIAAIAELRDDVFDALLGTLLSDIGWSQTPVPDVIRGLAKKEITCTRACMLLDKPAQILPPHYVENIEANPDSCRTIVEDLGSFLLANIRPEKEDGLFPADPFLHQTNPLSLALGACGVLYSIKKCGLEIPKPAYDWLERKLKQARPEDFAPGILTGASGIAWSLGELGFEDDAVRFMKIANESPILKDHHSYLYGMAGSGMANLYMYIRTGKCEYLAIAEDLAESLLGIARENNRGMYWEADNLVHIGYGYGQSGVALFLLRLHQLTGKENLLAAGRRAMEFDLSYGIVSENGVMSFPHTTSEPTALPYLEEGCAGIARVAMRYGIWGKMDMMLSEVHRKYASFPGLLFGLGSFVDVLIDAYLFSGNGKYLEIAKRPISGIQSIYLIKQKNGVAVPGDGLFRISCDYATGVAGVMRTLYRYTHLDKADFTLDDIITAVPARHEVQSEQISA
jgi:tRNA A-37 threonylcarbamoyl transferase component Bud32